MQGHPLVDQLRFTRAEFMRAIKGVPAADAMKRLLPMNCLSWNVGHLAWQEQRYFLRYGQGTTLFPNGRIQDFNHMAKPPRRPSQSSHGTRKRTNEFG